MIILEQFYTDQTSQTTLTYYDYYYIIINIKNKQKKNERIGKKESNEIIAIPAPPPKGGTLTLNPFILCLFCLPLIVDRTDLHSV